MAVPLVYPPVLNALRHKVGLEGHDLESCAARGVRRLARPLEQQRQLCIRLCKIAAAVQEGHDDRRRQMPRVTHGLNVGERLHERLPLRGILLISAAERDRPLWNSPGCTE